MYKFVTLSNLTLFVALAISTVAEFYSIVGLTSIFTGAVIPVVMMGGILGVGKLTALVWLRKYWTRANFALKAYLVPAVVVLALLTSLGVFGYLSKAHMEHGVTAGDVESKVLLIDEKINTQRENIKTARAALAQMDAQVNEIISKGTDAKTVERSVKIRKQQQSERASILSSIDTANTEIAKLNTERAPLAAESRKVEAEVGPIKYIAAMIYGDNPDANTLERAVRWVIILLVIVFDPLAIALVLAGNASKEWDAETPQEPVNEVPPSITITAEELPEPVEDIEEANKLLSEIEVVTVEPELPEPALTEVAEKEFSLADHPYLFKPFVHFTDIDPMPGNNPVEVSAATVESDPATEPATTDVTSNIETEGVTPVEMIDGEYAIFEGKHIARDALKNIRPDLFRLTADSGRPSSSDFGIKFPTAATKGDIFVRVDVLPNRVYKFDGKRWLELNKDTTDSYLHNEAYIRYLITKIGAGEYDAELLSETEKSQIEAYLNSRQQN